MFCFAFCLFVLRFADSWAAKLILWKKMAIIIYTESFKFKAPIFLDKKQNKYPPGGTTSPLLPTPYSLYT